MTVIAWDGKTLAADKRCTFGWQIAAVSKLERHDGHLLCASGCTSMGQEVIAWFKAGAVAADWPAQNRDPDKGASLVVVRPDGTLWRYENGPHPYRVESVPVAFASGGEAAMGAMLAGADAVRAVEIASMVHAGCGNGVDSMTLGD